MFKRSIGLMAAVWMAACGGNVETSSSAGGAGGTGGSEGGTTITGLGGMGGDTSSTTMSNTCSVPEPTACGPEVINNYPDPFYAYDPLKTPKSWITAIPNTPEVGNAAAGALLGPWTGEQIVNGMNVVMRRIGETLPDPITLGVWTEPLCGLPSDNPHMHEVDVPLANFTIEDLGIGYFRLTWMFDEPFTVPAGALVATSLTMTDLTVAVAIYSPPKAGVAPFGVWWGLVDNDCDKVTDPDLGWALLAKPTAPNVATLVSDEGFGLITAQ